MTPQEGRGGRLRLLAAPALILLVVLGLLALQFRPEDELRSRARVPVLANPAAEVMVGLTTLPLARNSYRAWDPPDLATVDEFERAINKHASIVMWFADWHANPRPDLRQLRAVTARGSVPMITWEPWDSRKELREPQPRYRLARITEGAFDAHIRRWARDLARFGDPVRLRFAHEMNGNWYPWSEIANGNSPGQFAAAWRHVWEIFEQEGADNVEWVWSPVATQVKPGEYPGDRYVDRLGLSGFVGGVQLRYKPYRPFLDIFGQPLRDLRVVAPDKPIEISEIGIAEEGGDKPRFIRDMFDQIDRMPDIDAVVLFNITKESDWRIETSPAAVDAFRTSVASPRYGQRAIGLGGLPGSRAPTALFGCC